MKAAQWDLTSHDLIEAAAAVGQEITARTLELWRYRGLLPRTERQAGGRGNWRYPPGTDRQLLRLLHWRQQTKNHDAICVALWIEGFPIEARRVRSALIGFVGSWERMIAAEIGKTPHADDRAVIDALAAKFAAMRSRAPLPRVVRMTANERRRAYGYMLAVMFGNARQIERRREDRRFAERMIGLRSGQGGGLASVLQLDQDESVMRLPSPADAREAISAVGARELAFVRQLVQFVAVWTPALAPAIVGDTGDRSHPVVRLMDTLKDPQPGFLSLLAIAFVVSLHSKSVASEELEEHAASLSSPDVDLEVLRSLPSGTRRAAYERLPAKRRESIRAGLQLAPSSGSVAR